MSLELPPIVHFQPVAGKVGFPERNGPLIYLPFCNFRCDYCLNTKVVLGKMPEMSFQKIEDHLKKFQETFIFISGGEPCQHRNLPNLVKRLKDLGVQVGLSTNGTYPDRLKSLIECDGIDFVAMDIKTDPNKPDKWEQVKFVADEMDNVLESIEIINSHVGRVGFGQEFRTTLYPPLVDESDLLSLADFLNPKSVWILQQFRARKGLLGGDWVSDVKPYEDEKLYKWLEQARAKIQETHLRWP
jgi:pyruvate formate lyase activating enzyme